MPHPLQGPSPLPPEVTDYLAERLLYSEAVPTLDAETGPEPETVPTSGPSAPGRDTSSPHLTLPVEERCPIRARRSVEHVHDRTLAEQGIAALLRLLGRDPATDTGVADTPVRAVKALLEIATSQANPAALLAKQFGGIDYPTDAMIAVGPIPFVSLCEHHLLPFPGIAWVAYVPGEDGRVVGLSKLPRLVDHYAASPQVQERLTTQIADALMEHLRPRGAAVLIRATHGCMTHRGVRKPGASMVTSVLRGVFKNDPTTRAEFLALTRDSA